MDKILLLIHAVRVKHFLEDSASSEYTWINIFCFFIYSDMYTLMKLMHKLDLHVLIFNVYYFREGHICLLMDMRIHQDCGFHV